MTKRLSGWSHTTALIAVLMAFLTVVDVASRALSPWLSRARESTLFRDLAALIAPPAFVRAPAWLWAMGLIAVGALAVALGDPASGIALAAVYQPSKHVVDLYAKLDATQKKINDVFVAGERGPDGAHILKTEKCLALTGATHERGVVDKIQEWNTQAEAEAKAWEDARRLDEIAQNTKGALEQRERDRRIPVHQPPLPGGSASASKRLGSIIVGSKPFKDYLTTKTPSGAVLEEDFGLTELKTLFQTTAGWPTESTRIPGFVIDAVTRPIQVLDIIPSGPTEQAAVVWVEETTRTHAAAERAEAAAYAESTFVLAEQSSTVRSIGDSIPVTDEQLEDVAGVEGYLNQRLEFGLRQRLDNQVLQGNGTAPNLRGILNVSGIQTQAKGTDPTPDAIYKAMTKVRVTGRAFPNAFLIHPNDWQDIRLLRTADGIYIWGSPSEAGPERIWGIRVVQTDVLTENTALVGDFATFCRLYERRGVEVQVGYVGTQFTEGKRTIRAGVRVAFAVFRATAYASVTGI